MEEVKMETVFRETVQMETLYDKIRKSKKMAYLHVDKVDGVSVMARLEPVNCQHKAYLRFTISCEWKSDTLICMCIHDNDELMDLLTKIIPNLEYSKTHHTLFVEVGKEDLSDELTKLIPTCDNIVLSIQECSVCLDKCITKTSCNHFICGQCESKINEKKCPVCRSYYHHPKNEDDD